MDEEKLPIQVDKINIHIYIYFERNLKINMNI